MIIPEPPNGWPYHVWHRLARRRHAVAAEVLASRPERRAWVYVSPRAEDQYQVTYFECEASRYKELANTWDEDLPGLVLNEQRFVASDLGELQRVISRWLSDLEKLSDPMTAAFPR